MSRMNIFFRSKFLKLAFIPEAAAAIEAAEVAAVTAEALEVAAAVSSYKCQFSSYNTGSLLPVSV